MQCQVQILCCADSISHVQGQWTSPLKTLSALMLELFAMGPVQFRGVAENWFTKLDFGELFVSFP